MAESCASKDSLEECAEESTVLIPKSVRRSRNNTVEEKRRMRKKTDKVQQKGFKIVEAPRQSWPVAVRAQFYVSTKIHS